MNVERSLAFDFSGHLPRLLQEEVQDISPANVMVRESKGVGVLNLSQLIPIAESLTNGYAEAANLVLEDHGLNEGVILADQTMYYIDPVYRNAVHEASLVYPVQMRSAGIDQEVYETVLEGVCSDIDSNTTEFTNALLENLVHDAHIAAANVDDQVNKGVGVAKNAVERAQSAIFNHIGKRIMGGIQNYMDNKDNANQFTQAAEKLGRRGGEAVVNGAIEGGKAKVNPYLKGAMIGVGGAAVLGAMAAPFMHLTDQDTINSASPSRAARMINALNNIKMKLEGQTKQPMCPPEKVGIIRTIINKIKAVIYALGRKVGLVK